MSFIFAKYYVQRIGLCEMSFEVMLCVYWTAFLSILLTQVNIMSHFTKRSFMSNLEGFLMKYFPYY